MVSGAGPSVLVLGTGTDLADRVRHALRSHEEVAGGAWVVLDLPISTQGACLITESP